MPETGNPNMQNRYGRVSYFLAKAFNVAAIAVLLAGFSMWAAKAQAHDDMVEQQIAEAERAASRGPYANDGIFIGSAQGYGGPVKMQVTVENGYLDSVEILDAGKEDDAWLEMCLDLPAKMVSAQTTSVDTVTGATFTSSGMINGATEALRQSIEGGTA